MALQQAQAAVLNAQAQEAMGRAAKYKVETEIMPKETVLKYSDMNKDGQLDDDFDKKIALAKMLMDEDRWALEKEERQSALQGAMQDRERQAADQDILRQMMQQQNQDLSQVTFEEEPLQ